MGCREKLMLRSPSEYKLLENCPRSAAVTQEMGSRYTETRDAMAKIGLGLEDQERLMQVRAHNPNPNPRRARRG